MSGIAPLKIKKLKEQLLKLRIEHRDSNQYDSELYRKERDLELEILAAGGNNKDLLETYPQEK